jgi:hypothetical protein
MTRGFGFVRKRHTFLIPRSLCRFPDRCACCLAPGPDSSLRLRSEMGRFKRRVFFGSIWEHLRVQVPFCKACADRQTRWRRAVQCWSVIVLVSAGVSIIWLDIGNLGQWVTAFVAVFLAFAPFWLLDSRLGVHVVGYDNNNLHVSFKSPEYAREFAVLNGLLEVVRPGGEVMSVPKQEQGP